MRKLVLAIVALLLVSIIGVSAEGIDLSGMSDSEISSLYDEVVNEMSSRGVLKNGDLIPGEYIVGKDIAAGSYNATVAGEEFVLYYIVPSEEIYNEYTRLLDYLPLQIPMPSFRAGDSMKLDLKDGQVLITKHDNLHLEEIRNTLMP